MWWSRREASPPPEPAAAAPAALPVTRAHWRSVPPIQRVVAEHPLVNPVQRFSSSLTSWRSPAYLEPLGHRVGPDEPAGVIGDLARPHALETSAPAMPVVQRATRKRSGLSQLWGASVQREASPEAAVPAPGEPAPASETVQLLPEEPAAPPMPALVLPVVTSHEVVWPLTSAGATAVPASPPVRTVQAIPEPSPVAAPAAVEPPPAEIAVPDPVVRVQTPEPTAADRPPAEPARPVLPVVQRSEQAAPRRLGLGAPILPEPGAVSPPAAAISPSAAAEEDAPLAGEVETTVLPAEEVPDPTPVATEAPLPVSRLADDVSPGMPTAIQRAVPDSPAPLSGASRPEPGQVTVSRMAESTAELPTVTSSRSSPVNTFRPLDTPEIRSGTAEPPGTPGGSTSVSPAPKLPLPVARAVETPQLPVTQAAEGLPSSPTWAVESSPLPVARTVEVAAPAVRTVEGAPLPVTRVVEDSPALVAVSVKGAPLPPTRAAETPVLAVARAIEGSPLPVTRTIETLAVPVARTAGTPALSVARAVEGAPPLVTRAAAAPVARAVEPPPLPVARTLAPVSTIPPPVAQPTPADPVHHTESAPLPTLPVSRAIETSAVPMSLPVARVLDAQSSAIQRTPTAPALPATFPLPPVVQREEKAAPFPVARGVDSFAAPSRPSMPSAGAPPVTEPLPVARIADHGRPSTVDFLSTVQRATNGSASHHDGLTLSIPPVVVARQAEAPIVQREPEPVPPTPAPAPVPAPQEPAAQLAAQPAAAQPETEELVKKLFDPLLRRLKTELRLDRERRGALTDRPH